MNFMCGNPRKYYLTKIMLHHGGMFFQIVDSAVCGLQCELPGNAIRAVLLLNFPAQCSTCGTADVVVVDGNVR